MPKQTVFTAQQAESAQRMDAGWNYEQWYNENATIGPLTQETVYITITPEQAAAMSDEEKAAYMARYRREQMEDIVRDQVHRSIMAVFDALTGGRGR
jgi:hypothetical protein